MGAMRKRQAVKGGDYSNDQIDHIGKQEVCLFPQGRPIKQGERMFIQVLQFQEQLVNLWTNHQTGKL
jgi:hypothetical protein